MISFFSRHLLTWLVLIAVNLASLPAFGCATSTATTCSSVCWLRVNRTEMLSLADWNTPVTGTNPTHVPPAPEGSGPVSIKLSNSTIDDGFSGFVDLNIEGLSLGQSALVEKFKVENDQGIIDASAQLVASDIVTDGQASMAGEVFNFNLVQDVTDRDGKIEIQLDFWTPNSASVAGEYIFRVSSPLGSFSPQKARFTVTAGSTAQGFIGTVTNGGSPVPGAIVALLDPLGDYSDFVKGTTADKNGDYELSAPYEDEYDIVALKPGYVGPLSVATEWILEEGETVTADLQLQEGTRKISGTLVDATTNKTLPGVELILITANSDGSNDGRGVSVAWTDASGAFSAMVTPDVWGVGVRRQTAGQIGYIVPQRTFSALANTSEGDVTGLRVPLTPATSIIWGEVTSSETDENGDPVPLCGVEVVAASALDGEDNLAWAVTDGDGSFRLAVTPGRWSVYPFTYSLEDVNHAGGVSRTVSVTGTNQSIENSFTARPWTGEVFGSISNEMEEPVGRLRLSALNTDLDIREEMVQATYQSDGYYSFILPPGEWTLMPDPAQSSRRGLLFKNLPTVGMELDSEIQKDINVVEPTSTIELSVTDESANPLPNLIVHGFGVSGQDKYDSFAQTDADGIARIPSIPGVWEVHISSLSLREYGMKGADPIQVEVSRTTAMTSAQMTPYSRIMPELTMERSDGQSFKFNAAADSGRIYAIEASTNLKSWYEIGIVRGEEGALGMEDSSGRDQVFYRVKPN